VMGCPRSGTSLTTNLIRSAGYDVDNFGKQRLMKPNSIHNPDGYFERIDVVETNDELIKAMYGDDKTFLNLPYNQNPSECRLKEKEDIEKELNSYGGWVIKDSRLCLTFPAWDLQNVSIVKVKRNTKSVKRSMEKHYGNIFEEDVFYYKGIVKQIDFDTYYDYYDSIINKHIQNVDSVELTYESILEGKLSELEDFIEGKVDFGIINQEYNHNG